MRRWHQEQAHMLRQWKIEMGQHGYDWRNPPTDPEACHCAKGIGSVRKKKALDCGNPKCGACHGDKFFGPKRRSNERRKAIEEDMCL